VRFVAAVSVDEERRTPVYKSLPPSGPRLFCRMLLDPRFPKTKKTPKNQQKNRPIGRLKCLPMGWLCFRARCRSRLLPHSVGVKVVHPNELPRIPLGD